MKNLSWKTTVIGIFGMLTLIGAGALVYFGKATFAEVAAGLSFVTAFLTGLAAIIAKDADKTGLPNG